MRVWKVIKVAILAINNTVSGCLDQYISIIAINEQVRDFA